MANIYPETMTGFRTSSDADPPPRSRWWTQSYSLLLRCNQLTEEETTALTKPYTYGIVTFIAFAILVQCLLISFNKHIPCRHASFSVQSITVSPSSSTWHVDFLVKNHTSRCLVNYDGDDVYAKVGSSKAAVLRTSHTHSSHGYESFSVVLVTGNQSHVVAGSPVVFELEVKLSGKKKLLTLRDEIGLFNIRCQNVMIGHVNVKCHSSFKKLKQCC